MQSGNRQPVIEVSDLVSRYGDRQVLNEVSLQVAAAEIHVVLGPSGCGKSTLLKTMVGLLEPAQGSIKLFGEEIIGLDEERLARLLTRVGMLFQGGALIQSLTVLENAVLPLREHTALTVAEAELVARMKLATVGLASYDHLLPAELSGGMRKRAALARALALDPEVVFCDEPNSGLDPVTAAGIDRLLLDLRAALGITMVVVSHELNSIRRIGDRITMLNEGAVVAQGTPAELEQSSDPRIRSFFLGLPAAEGGQDRLMEELFLD